MVKSDQPLWERKRAYWLRNVRAFLQDHTEQHPLDRPVVNTREPDSVSDHDEMLEVPADDLDRRERASLIHTLESVGFHVTSGSSYRNVVIADGDPLVHEFDPEQRGYPDKTEEDI